MDYSYAVLVDSVGGDSAFEEEKKNFSLKQEDMFDFVSMSISDAQPRSRLTVFTNSERKSYELSQLRSKWHGPRPIFGLPRLMDKERVSSVDVEEQKPAEGRSAHIGRPDVDCFASRSATSAIRSYIGKDEKLGLKVNLLVALMDDVVDPRDINKISINTNTYSGY
ncbi:hypothetical protein PROFUN_00648 [Planoprotostelium fungivorum]|uniref:Uncharacterized protein n=1 Tax=Planoprotostelium fungivorum TaxID=1890364 RepID=A0A2P6NTY1_9EUKA|nr:hypothetical protein PROFUN_00648 [Planoprotostelium fungivorum]